MIFFFLWETQQLVLFSETWDWNVLCECSPSEQELVQNSHKTVFVPINSSIRSYKGNDLYIYLLYLSIIFRNQRSWIWWSSRAEWSNCWQSRCPKMSRVRKTWHHTLEGMPVFHASLDRYCHSFFVLLHSVACLLCCYLNIIIPISCPNGTIKSVWVQ